MSDDDEDRSFDDARETFDADPNGTRDGRDDAGGVVPSFVPHEDQRGVDGFDGASDDDGGSDGVVDADDDFAGSMDDESEGEDLMNDMERCVEGETWRSRRRLFFQKEKQTQRQPTRMRETRMRDALLAGSLAGFRCRLEYRLIFSK